LNHGAGRPKEYEVLEDNANTHSEFVYQREQEQIWANQVSQLQSSCILNALTSSPLFLYPIMATTFSQPQSDDIMVQSPLKDVLLLSNHHFP